VVQVHQPSLTDHLDGLTGQPAARRVDAKLIVPAAETFRVADGTAGAA
jgi:hypothetical protein